MQRKEDKRLLPLHGSGVRADRRRVGGRGRGHGGFTMYTMILLGVVLGALVAFVVFGRRARSPCSRRPRARPARPHGRWTIFAASGG